MLWATRKRAPAATPSAAIKAHKRPRIYVARAGRGGLRRACSSSCGKLGTVTRIARRRPGRPTRSRSRASATAPSAGTSSTPATGSCSPTRAARGRGRRGAAVGVGHVRAAAAAHGRRRAARSRCRTTCSTSSPATTRTRCAASTTTAGSIGDESGDLRRRAVAHRRAARDPARRHRRRRDRSMAEAEQPERLRRDRDVTVDDVRQLMGASTPHFALPAAQPHPHADRAACRPTTRRGCSASARSRGSSGSASPARSAASPSRTASGRCRASASTSSRATCRGADDAAEHPRGRRARAARCCALRARARGAHAEAARNVVLTILLAQLLAARAHDGPPATPPGARRAPGPRAPAPTTRSRAASAGAAAAVRAGDRRERLWSVDRADPTARRHPRLRPDRAVAGRPLRGRRCATGCAASPACRCSARCSASRPGGRRCGSSCATPRGALPCSMWREDFDKLRLGALGRRRAGGRRRRLRLLPRLAHVLARRSPSR